MPNDQQEEKDAQNLRQARAQDAKKSAQNPFSEEEKKEIGKLEKLAENKEKIVTFCLTPVIAFGNAALNYMAIGSIPLIGDLPDLAAGVGISGLLLTLKGHPKWKAQAWIWILTAVEIIPGADLFSPQLLGTLIALFIAWRAGGKAEKKLEEIKEQKMMAGALAE